MQGINITNCDVTTWSWVNLVNPREEPRYKATQLPDCTEPCPCTGNILEAPELGTWYDSRMFNGDTFVGGDSLEG